MSKDINWNKYFSEQSDTEENNISDKLEMNATESNKIIHKKAQSALGKKIDTSSELKFLTHEMSPVTDKEQPQEIEGLVLAYVPRDLINSSPSIKPVDICGKLQLNKKFYLLIEEQEGE